MAISPFTEDVIKAIKAIPKGKVATYGQIATIAGNPRASRQVSRILRSMSKKEKLPWQRVIGSSGKISMPPGAGYEEQKALLLREKIRFSLSDNIDLKEFLWNPSGKNMR